MQWTIQALQLMVFFGAFGAWVDGQATAAQKTGTAQQLRAGGVGNLLGGLFKKLFDRIFDPRGKGRPLFLRAGLVSCAVLAILSLNWIKFQGERAKPALEITLSTPESAVFNATTLVIFVVVLNLIADYFSLWETRLVLGWMANTRSKTKLSSLVVLDLAATIAIYCVGFTIAMSLLAVLFRAPAARDGLVALLGYIGMLLLAVFVEGGLIFRHGDVTIDPFALFFYTSLVTSVWVWGFVLGAIAWSVLGRLLPVMLGTLYRKNPVTCVMAMGGFCLAVGLTAVRLVWGALRLLPWWPA